MSRSRAMSRFSSDGWSFFSCPSPLPFDASTVLSLTRRPAGNRTTTGSPSATQECRDTNWATRTPSSDRWRWASQNIKSIIPHPVQCPDSTLTVVLVTQLVSRHSCVANRLVWSATTIQKRISLSGQQPIRLVNLFVSCNTVTFHHCVHGNLGCGYFDGPCPVRFLLCFSAGWRSASGWGDCVSPFAVCVCCFVLLICPTYMTTGLHVDVIF